MDPTSEKPKCIECKKAYALKQPDPDGARRCFAHSVDPVIIEKRAAAGQAGALVAEKYRGTRVNERRAVLAGVIPIEGARKRKAAAPADESVDPHPLDTKERVFDFLANAAGRLLKGYDPKEATAAAALARTALAAMGLEEQERDGDEPARGFSYETTTGDKVAVRGRGDDGVH